MIRYKFLYRLLGPALFLIILLFFVDLNQLVQTRRYLKYEYLAFSLLIVPFIVAIRSTRWQRILTVCGMPYSVTTCFRYIFIELIAATIVSSAGTFIKSFYLRRDGYKLSKAILSIFTDKAFDYLLPLLFGVFSAVTLYYNLDPSKALLCFILALAILYKPLQMTGLWIFPRTVPKRLKKKMTENKWRLEDHLRQMIIALDYRAYLLSILGFLLYYLSIFFLNLGLGLNFSFAQIVCIMALTSLIAALPISFMGIGTRDAALIAVFAWYGRSVEEAVSLSLGLLLLRLAVMVMGAAFWLHDPPPLTRLH